MLLILSSNSNAQDAAVEQIVMDDVYAAGGQETVRIKFKNAGTTSFSGITLNWSTDGGTTVNSYPLPGFPFSPGSSFTIDHSVKVVFANPGTFTDMKVWTSNPGNNTDINTANDTLVKQIFVNTGTTVSKGVLIEEFTTVPCGYCPDGGYTLENVLTSNPNAVGVGIHAGFGTDAMTIPEHSTIASAYTTSAPAAAIDRFRFTASGNLATSARSQWNPRTQLRQSLGSPVDIVISGNYDNVTRQTYIKVSANWVDYPLPGDIRIGLYLVEDSVVGSGPGYNQRNFYNNASGHPYFGAGDPIYGYPHRHVVRGVRPQGNPWGQSGLVATFPQQNTTDTVAYNFTLPTAWDAEQMSVVAFLAYYNSSTDERNIINAKEQKLFQISTGIKKQESSIAEVSLYPNPANEQVFVNYKLDKAASVQVNILDLTGKIVAQDFRGNLAAGNQQALLNISGLAAGIYFVELNANGQKSIHKLSVK